MQHAIVAGSPCAVLPGNAVSRRVRHVLGASEPGCSARLASFPSRRTRSARLSVVSHAHPGSEAAPANKQGQAASNGHGHGHMMMQKDTGFVADMRAIAMKLHTKEQAPKEGQAQKPANEKPMPQWKPTKEGYLQFLVESKAVYEMMEGLAKTSSSPIYSKFRNTGLERTEALDKDIKWFESMGVKAQPATGAGVEYAKYLKDLAARDPPSFICHFYNVYFAHTAGGRMIGKKVSDMILDGHNLQFYQWEGSLEDHMAAVKKSLNEVAEGWSAEEKKRCLEETELSFKYSGALLRYVAG